MAFLGYLPKLKRDLGIASGTHFLHDFPIEMFLIQYSYQWTKFQCHTFFLLKIKYVIKFLFRQLMTSQTLRFICHQPLKQWLTGRKRGEDGNTKT